jgi:acyl-CoA thioesterase-1
MRPFVPFLAAALAIASAAAAAAETRCQSPADITRLDAPLPRTASRLRAGAPLTVITIGSSSTAGFGASAPAKAYPARLGIELAQRLPGRKIEVLNKGVGGEEARDMLRRFDSDVVALRPDLVIWQLGTNSVIREEDLSRFTAVVREGITRIRATGADVLLMDMQFAPKVTMHPHHRDMQRALVEIGREMRVPVFHRFALMQHWVNSGQITTKRMLSPDGLHLNDLSYSCLARSLAETLVAQAVDLPLTSQR